MNILRATLADVRAIAEIHVGAWRAAYARILPAGYLSTLSVEQREAMWRAAVESGQPELLVAKDGCTVLGWVAFGACRDPDATPFQAEVWAIYIAPVNWSSGVGRQLWQQTRDILSARGYSTCSLWVLPENERAIRFYRAAGFVTDDVPARQLELGGRLLQEVRYVCRIDL
ncbi:GNAT family N-acetyltransferase [Pseudomonas sp. NY15366]|jgi:L-amino acid N-acyltransferase YncA|nr:GNAT family N-acetyltransferase [Pseudomonas sp.]